jgi:hypothetical protein
VARRLLLHFKLATILPLRDPAFFVFRVSVFKELPSNFVPQPLFKLVLESLLESAPTPSIFTRNEFLVRFRNLIFTEFNLVR